MSRGWLRGVGKGRERLLEVSFSLAIHVVKAADDADERSGQHQPWRQVVPTVEPPSQQGQYRDDSTQLKPGTHEGQRIGPIVGIRPATTRRLEGRLGHDFRSVLKFKRHQRGHKVGR